MEVEDMVIKIRFLRQKGQCPIGYEAEFPKEHAKQLIKDGFAEAVKPPIKTNVKVKNKTNVEIDIKVNNKSKDIIETDK